jgi:hypothetical protein
VGCVTCSHSETLSNRVPGCSIYGTVSAVNNSNRSRAVAEDSASCEPFNVSVSRLTLLDDARVMGVRVGVRVAETLHIGEQGALITSDAAAYSDLWTTANRLLNDGQIMFSSIDIRYHV